MELPAQVREMVCSVVVEQMSPAWLRVDLAGRPVAWGGALAAFGIVRLEPGQPIGPQIDFLQGVLPLTAGRLVLRHLATQPGLSIDVHLSHDAEGDWVLLLDTTRERRALADAQQRLHDLAPLPGRPFPAGDGLMADLLAELDILVLDREADGVLRPVGSAPEWVGSLGRQPASDSADWRPGVRFPFLDPFLTDAQAFWMQPGSGVLRSGVWSETDASGGECYFEASAVSLGVCRLLLIERLGSAYREKQHLIQTGREINLRLGKQERAAGTLALTNADLERRVAHGTVELARATERLQALSHRLMGAQEAERRHIARELHDEIGQSLTAVILSLRMTQETLGAGPVASSLQDSIALVERVLQQARDLSLDLRPSLLDDLGLAAALRWHMDRHARRGGLSTTVTTDVLEPRPGPEIEITCFRVAQEALTNIIRHARATHVTMELRVRPAEIELVVRDDGVGFDVIGARRRATGGQSLGLLGMEERLLLAGGRLDIESAPGRGTVIRAHLPRRPLTFSAQDMGDG